MSLHLVRPSLVYGFMGKPSRVQFVMTSTNAQQVEALAGSRQHVYEVGGKPVDLDQIVTAVKEALRARPTR